MKPQLKSLRLLKNNGQFGFILPNNILRTTVYDVVRKQLIQNWKIRKIIDLKSGVFKGVTASTIILIIEAINPSEEHNIEIINNTNEGTIKETSISKIKQNECIKNPSFVINIFSDKYTISIFEKMNKNSFNLGSLIKVLNGIATGKDKAGLLERKINQNSKPIIFGKDISRYYFKWSGKYVNYVRESLLRARDESIFLSSEKLIMQRIGGILITAYDDQKYYTFNSVNNLLLKANCQYSLKFILGILNSKLLKYYYVTRFTNRSSLTVNISKTFLDQLPIPSLDLNNSSDKCFYEKMVSLVNQMLASRKQAAHTPQSKEALQREIEATDKQIDQLVYELYGLTGEEIEIVEGGS